MAQIARIVYDDIASVLSDITKHTWQELACDDLEIEELDNTSFKASLRHYAICPVCHKMYYIAPWGSLCLCQEPYNAPTGTVDAFEAGKAAREKAVENSRLLRAFLNTAITCPFIHTSILDKAIEQYLRSTGDGAYLAHPMFKQVLEAIQIAIMRYKKPKQHNVTAYVKWIEDALTEDWRTLCAK